MKSLLMACALLLLWQTHGWAQPNILVVMTDDLGWADNSVNEMTFSNPSPFIQTPALQRMACEGMSFPRGYAAPGCTPGRSAFLTGLYAQRPLNNIYMVSTTNNGNPGSLLVGVDQGFGNNRDELQDAAITLAEVLQAEGYSCCTVGKYHVGIPGTANGPLNQGFHANFGGNNGGSPGPYHAENQMFGPQVEPELDAYANDYDFLYWFNNILPYTMGLPPGCFGFGDLSDKHLTDASVDASFDWSENLAPPGPQFVLLSLHAPHVPIQQVSSRLDLQTKYKKIGNPTATEIGYRGVVEGADQALARWMDFIDSSQDDWFVLFVSDNGGAPLAHQGPLSGRKGTMLEGGIRVTTGAWDNYGLISPGISEAQVELIDWFATIASLAGATPSTDGQDLTAVLGNPNLTLSRPIRQHFPAYVQTQGRDQRPVSISNDQDWKLVYNYEDQSYELYDLSTDIGETTDVSSLEQARVATMAEDLMNWLDATGAPLCTLRTGSVQLFVDGWAYSNGVITEYFGQNITINAGEEMPMVRQR